jgi:glycerol transport system ATP-binding protein
MQLALDQISKKVGAEPWLYDMSLAPRSGAVTVLLGATQAGKTSLMRIMAGLDVPTQGKVRVNGADVTGLPVRERNVAMVYQQFINYPSLRVADNIASPLQAARRKRHCAEACAAGRAAAHRVFPGPLPGRTLRRPAAARGPGARAGQGRAADAARRAAGQPRLQAARGTARRAAQLFAAGDRPP